MNFGEAIEALKEGKAIQREGWHGKGMFVVKQVPSHIEGTIIPKMTSLPQSAKDILLSRENPHIDYEHQLLIIHPDSTADTFLPNCYDLFADDWQIVGKPYDFKDRIIKEYKELKDKIFKLDKVLVSKGFVDKVGEKQFNLMKSQLGHMTGYMYVLELRMSDLEIKYEEDN